MGLPPVWVDLSEEIAANVQRARTKMGELAKAHSKALMPSFGDGKEDQRAIETLTHEITDLIKKSEKRLRRLSATGPSEDSNVRKNVQVRLLNSHDADEMDDGFFLFPHNNVCALFNLKSFGHFMNQA